MAAAKDRVTVGLTQEGAGHLQRVMDSEWFATEVAACRSAIACALASGVAKPAEEMKDLTTKFNQGTLDPDGSIREMILIFCDVEERSRPIAFAERLMEAGLAEMASRLTIDQLGLIEALGLPSSTPST